MDDEVSGAKTIAVIGIVLVLLGGGIIIASYSAEFWLGIVLGILAAAAGSIMLRKLL